MHAACRIYEAFKRNAGEHFAEFLKYRLPVFALFIGENDTFRLNLTAFQKTESLYDPFKLT